MHYPRNGVAHTRATVRRQSGPRIWALRPVTVILVRSAKPPGTLSTPWKLQGTPLRPGFESLYLDLAIAQPLVTGAKANSLSYRNPLQTVGNHTHQFGLWAVTLPNPGGKQAYLNMQVIQLPSAGAPTLSNVQASIY